ncbi:MAG: TonB-dependent receptor, partial [Planctomycetota bacterium]|nr:TonB-dependent receptor [Planctomycetota bacterium]
GFSPNTTDYYTERNAFRLAPFHKLDLNLIHEITLFGLASELNLSVYNAYNHLNPFALYVTSEFNTDTGEYGRVVKQITLFPIIPSLGLRFKF